MVCNSLFGERHRKTAETEEDRKKIRVQSHIYDAVLFSRCIVFLAKCFAVFFRTVPCSEDSKVGGGLGEDSGKKSYRTSYY